MLWELHKGKPTEAVELSGMPDVTAEVLLPGRGHVPMADNDSEFIDTAAAVKEMTTGAVLATCDLRRLYWAAAVEVTAVRMPRKDDALP
jgi:hypothetical protein